MVGTGEYLAGRCSHVDADRTVIDCAGYLSVRITDDTADLSSVVVCACSSLTILLEVDGLQGVADKTVVCTVSDSECIGVTITGNTCDSRSSAGSIDKGGLGNSICGFNGDSARVV